MRGLVEDVHCYQLTTETQRIPGVNTKGTKDTKNMRGSRD